MDIEILTLQDDFFKIIGLSSPKLDNNSDIPVENEISKVEELPVEEVQYNQPKPAPIENQRGLDWFNGTSWGNS